MSAKKCCFVGIVILLSLSVAIAAPPAVHPTTGEPLVIDCLRGTPDAIDGDLSDWNLEAMTPAVLDVVEQLFSGQTAWTGPEDCSGQFYLMWDDQNIYIAVVAKDEKLSMNKTGGNIWNADCVEVFFATTNAVAGHAEHYQYGFNAQNQKWNWDNMDGNGNREPDYLQIASSATADGYICEVAIPYGQMMSLDFSAGNAIGFHAVFDDTDDGDRELQMTWTGREAHDQSLGFGQIILSAESVPGPVPVEPGADGLVASYALDTDASDSSGNGFNGTLFGDPEFVEGPPGYGMAMFFDGDDYVDTGNALNLANWTISTWVKSPAAPGATSPSGPVHREKNFQLNWNHSNATFREAAALRVGGTWYAASYGPAEADTWYNITATYDGEDLKAYRDGVLITTNSTPSGPPDAETGTLKLGRHATSATQYFTGTVDEATIYSRALSYGEVRYLAGYRAGTGEADPSQVIYYSFDSVDGVAADQSGKGHDGTVVGDVTAEAAGKYNGAAKLANTGYLDLDGPNFPAEDIPTSGMTLAAWTNIDGTSNQNAIFNARASDTTWLIHPEIRPGNGDYRFTVRKYGGVTMGNINGGTPGYKQPEGTPVPNEWVHVAMTFSRADARVIIYINGEVVADAATTEDADMAGDWGLGARVGYNIDDARHYSGLMDEFRMFTRALSQDEIKTIMQGP